MRRDAGGFHQAGSFDQERTVRNAEWNCQVGGATYSISRRRMQNVLWRRPSMSSESISQSPNSSPTQQGPRHSHTRPPWPAPCGQYRSRWAGVRSADFPHDPPSFRSFPSMDKPRAPPSPSPPPLCLSPSHTVNWNHTAAPRILRKQFARLHSTFFFLTPHWHTVAHPHTRLPGTD